MSSSEYKQPRIQVKGWRPAAVAAWQRLPTLVIRIFGVWVFAHLVVALPLLLRAQWLANWSLLNVGFSVEVLFIAGWSAAFAFGQLWGISLFYACLPLSYVVGESWILSWQAPFYKIVDGRLHSDPSGLVLANICMVLLVGFTHNMARRRSTNASRANGGYVGSANCENISERELAPTPRPALRWQSALRALIVEFFHRRREGGPAFYGAGFRRLIFWAPRVFGALLLLSALWNIQSAHHLSRGVGSGDMAGYSVFAHWRVIGWLLSFVAAVSLLLAPAWGYCAYAAMVSVFAFSGQIALPFGWTINKNILDIARPEIFNAFLVATLLNAAILFVCGILQSLTMGVCRPGAPSAQRKSGGERNL